jgi:hypothetical protein
MSEKICPIKSLKCKVAGCPYEVQMHENLETFGLMREPEHAQLCSFYFFLILLLLLLLGPFHFYATRLHTTTLFKTFTAC